MQLINDICTKNGVLITTYESVLKYKAMLVEKRWHYLILDEGHKIRNRNAKVKMCSHLEINIIRLNIKLIKILRVPSFRMQRRLSQVARYSECQRNYQLYSVVLFLSNAKDAYNGFMLHQWFIISRWCVLIGS